MGACETAGAAPSKIPCAGVSHYLNTRLRTEDNLRAHHALSLSSSPATPSGVARAQLADCGRAENVRRTSGRVPVC